MRKPSNVPDLNPDACFRILYDLRDEEAGELARWHRRFWGRRFCEVLPLDRNYVVLTFRPSQDPKWRAWEEVRRRRIFGEKIGTGRAA
jgi:hypothetical protein